MSKYITITWFVPITKKSLVMRIFGREVWHPRNNPLASIWIRGFQLGYYLRKYGYKINVNTLSPKPDVAIFLRRYGREDLELASWLKKNGTKVILDVVANYFSTHEYCNQEMQRIFLKFVELADHVWCVSPYLTDLAAQYNCNSYFVSDSIDPKHFNPNIHKRSKINSDYFVLGWAGYSLKANYLTLLKDFIDSKRYRILIISEKKPALGFEYIFRKWNYDRFPQYISECDLCVAPRVVDDEYNKGHSIFKIGVFMAMGVPVLASPVPAYNLLLKNNNGGAICNTLDDWIYWFEQYSANPNLRVRWSIEAQQAIIPYLTPNISKEIHNLIKKLLL